MNGVKTIIKAISAGVMSIFILSILTMWYDFLPIHINNPRNNTDYVWEPNSFWIRTNEGISWGRVDGNGYNNEKVILHPEIVILGSSHMEAMNVLPHENTAALMKRYYADKYSVYNLGISGHSFFKVLHYLPVNLKFYSPKIAIIETSTLDFTDKQINDFFQENYSGTKSYDSGIIYYLQKVPFFRLLYQQYVHGLGNLFLKQNYSSFDNIPVENSVSTYSKYRKVLEFLSQQQNSYHTKIIVMYHPQIRFDSNGNLIHKEDIGVREFEQLAKEYNITVVDMTQDFENMYLVNHRLPHGFITGKIGEGHLNADGHAAIAKSLERKIDSWGQL